MPSPETRPPPPARLVATGAGVTHRGRVRELNEDAILTDPTGALWVVADGLGGHGHGDLAADIVIDAFARLPHGAAGRSALQDAIASAHAEVRRRARAGGLGSIGATVVALAIDGGRATVAWAGDSRLYLWRAGTLERLTRDHSLVQELIDRGAIGASEAETHPERNVVTRAVGASDQVEPAFLELALREGDSLLLCSDGLTRCVSDSGIAELLAGAVTPDAACRDLVEAALARGAPDNVSVIVIRIDRPEAP
jgi:serine/threonine protein phosphatase PrpC